MHSHSKMKNKKKSFMHAYMDLLKIKT